MDFAAIAGLTLFATVAAFTPGPNNVMLAASGATFGFRRTVPHMLGVIVGFAVMLLASGFGFATILGNFPALHRIMQVAGVAFLVYLAWKVGTAGRATTGNRSNPVSFWQAAAFQLINPKGLTLVASIVAVFSSGPDSVSADMRIWFPILLTLTAGSACTWCVFGQMIGHLLKADIALRRFNILMAVLLLLSLVPIVIGADTLS